MLITTHKMNHLVSFADSRMQIALTRLRIQAEQFELFASVHLFNENDLSSSFKCSLKERLIAGTRGYGYWTWKPEVISIALDAIQPGDCLLYVDAGCHLNVGGKVRMQEYFDVVRQSRNGVLAFQANTPNEINSKLVYDGRPLFEQPNYRWIKGDVFEYYGVKNDFNVTNAQAIGAGVILFRKCDAACAIVREWRNLALSRFDLFDDSPSISKNLDGFIEHRHDQAIWTLLCLKNNVETISAYEYWYPLQSGKKLKPDWEALQAFPIHAKRDIKIGVMGALARKMGILKRRIFRGLDGFK